MNRYTWLIMTSLRRCTCTQFDNEDPSIKHPSERQIFKHYVSHGPIQPSDGFIRNDEGRSFRAEWFNRFPWLEYSLLKQSAFCFYCRHFANEGSSTGRGGNVEAAFTSNGKLNLANEIRYFIEAHTSFGKGSIKQEFLQNRIPSNLKIVRSSIQNKSKFLPVHRH